MRKNIFSHFVVVSTINAPIYSWRPNSHPMTKRKSSEKETKYDEKKKALKWKNICDSAHSSPFAYWSDCDHRTNKKKKTHRQKRRRKEIPVKNRVNVLFPFRPINFVLDENCVNISHFGFDRHKLKLYNNKFTGPKSIWLYIFVNAFAFSGRTNYEQYEMK